MINVRLFHVSTQLSMQGLTSRDLVAYCLVCLLNRFNCQDCQFSSFLLLDPFQVVVNCCPADFDRHGHRIDGFGPVKHATAVQDR